MPIGRPWTEAEYKRNVAAKDKELGRRFIVKSGSFRGMQHPIEVACLDCDHTWSTKALNLVSARQSCPKCMAGPTLRRRAAKIARQHDDYLKRLKKVYSGLADVTLSHEIVHQDGVASQGFLAWRVSARCHACAHQWSPKLDNVLTKQTGCPKCSGHSRWDKALFTSLLKKLVDKKSISVRRPPDSYKGYSRATFHCSRHDTEFTCSGYRLEDRVRTNIPLCPSCSQDHHYGDQLTRGRQLYTERLLELHDNLSMDPTAVYTGQVNPYSVVCSKHGVVYRARAQCFLTLGCPKCRNRTSRPHKTVYDFLSGLVGADQVQSNRRSILGDGKELDLYVPSLNLAVEINGVYWHEKHHTRYHKDKTARCEELGIRLVHLWDTEVSKSWEKVQSVLKSAVGACTSVGARKLTVMEVSNADAKTFYTKYHLQGHRQLTKKSVNVALVDGNRIMHMTSFDSPQFDKRAEWEIVRSASRLGYNIQGGFSRALKHFERTRRPVSVCTYADRRLYSGQSYVQAGFKFVKNSAPNYWYLHFETEEKLSRYQCQKHKLRDRLDDFEPSLSEFENMKANGYYRVYDAGNKVFLKTYSTPPTARPSIRQIEEMAAM